MPKKSIVKKLSLIALPLLKDQMDKLAPITLDLDLSYLEPNERKVIKLLVKASRVIDIAFKRQLSERNMKMQRELKKFSDTPNEIYYDYFRIMQGPINSNI